MEDQSNQLLIHPSNGNVEDGTQKTQTLLPTHEDDCFIYYEKYAPSVHPDIKDGDTPVANQDDTNTATTLPNPCKKCISTVCKIIVGIGMVYCVIRFLFLE